MWHFPASSYVMKPERILVFICFLLGLIHGTKSWLVSFSLAMVRNRETILLALEGDEVCCVKLNTREAPPQRTNEAK